MRWRYKQWALIYFPGLVGEEDWLGRQSPSTNGIKRWNKFMEKLDKLNIPRYTPFSTMDVEQEGLQLHIFCDASERAYGAIAYVREDRNDTSPVQLLCAKTRVTSLPKKEMSITRKEWLGALLGSKLSQRVLNAINSSKITVYFWTDSMVTLQCIQGQPARFKQFVRNRTELIR